MVVEDDVDQPPVELHAEQVRADGLDVDHQRVVVDGDGVAAHAYLLGLGVWRRERPTATQRLANSWLPGANARVSGAAWRRR